MPIAGMPSGPSAGIVPGRVDFAQKKKQGKNKLMTAGKQPKGMVGGHKKSGKLPAFMKSGIPHK